MNIEDIEKIMKLMAAHEISKLKYEGLELLKTIHKQEPIDEPEEELSDAALFYSSEG